MSIKDSNLKLALKNLFVAKRKDCIVLEPHMGLGDGLICLGLLKTIAAREPNIQFYFACLPIYFHSVAWMLKDLSNVIPVAVNSGREARQYAQFKNATYMPIGIHNVDIGRFDEIFYEQHQVPFKQRWELAKTSPGPHSRDLLQKFNPNGEPFILVCHKDSSGKVHELNLGNESNLLVIKVYPATNNIFDWIDLVINAQEIHTIDTAFIHLVESALSKDTKTKLFFHRIRQSPTEFTRRLPWHEVRY